MMQEVVQLGIQLGIQADLADSESASASAVPDNSLELPGEEYFVFPDDSYLELPE